ncbi:MAG: TonB-dependent receptor plug domain-containing protein [Vitreoscilla sp.]
MYQRKTICSSVALALTTLMASAAQAQDTDLQRVEITGSSIKRIAIEGALPIQTLTADDIKKTGATSVTELIQNLSSMQGFTTESQSVNGGGGGVTTASLHDLGSKYTLVLLNGHRMAPFNTGSEVNLNGIPLSAVERVEVLSDGASALYGADAIAGVVNFILKKDTTAGALTASANIPQKAGGRSATVSIGKGFGDLSKDRYNVYLAASFDKQQALNASQRSFSRSGALKFNDAYGAQEVDLLSSNSVPANATVKLSNGSTIYINPNKLTSGSCAANSIASGDRCLYDYAATVQDIPASKRASLLGSGRFELNDKVTLFADLAYSHYAMDARYAAVAQPFSISSALLTKDIDPLLSGLGYDSSVTASSGTMNVRLLDTGGRTDGYQTNTMHTVVGADLSIGNWDSSFSFTHSRNHWYDKAEGGYASTNAIESLITSGDFDPLTSQPGAATALLASAVLHQTLDQSRSTLDVLSARTSTLLAHLPGGDLGFGTGIDLTRQKYVDRPSAIAQGTNSLQPDYTDSVFGGSSGALPFDSSRSSWGAFAELNAPITKTLEIDASARYDSYGDVKNKDGFSTTGDFIGQTSQGKKSSSATYKLSAAFRPLKELLVRGSIGTGFKMPTIGDISSPLQAYGNTGMHSCPIGLSDDKAAYCFSVPYEYNVQAGGNPSTDGGALKPERSTQWTLGFRVEPSPALSLGADLWTVRLHDQINTITEDTAFGNGAAYGDLFKIANDPISGQPTLTFLEVPINTGNAFYQGVDFDGESRVDTPVGRLTARGHMTWMLRADYQNPGDPEYVNSMDKVGSDGKVTFRYQVNASLSLQHGAFQYTVGGNLKSRYKDDTTDYCYDTASGFSGDSDNCTVNSANRRVSSYVTFDFQTKYDVNKALSLTGGIKNVFDRNPPFTLNDQSGTGNARGYDGRYASALGRTLYLAGNYAF